MSKPEFIYVIYIHSTPEKKWQALIDPEMTKEFWGRHRNRSDWKVGSAWSHQNYDDAGDVSVAGTVVESDPPRRGERLVRLDDRDEVVRHPGQLRGVGLRRPEVEVPVHRLRVGADDLRAQALGQLERELGLSGAGGAGDDGEHRLG